MPQTTPIFTLKRGAIFAAAFCAAWSLAHHANAVVLPWLDDPWKVEEKVAGYGTRNKPVTCPPPPDTKQILNVDQVVVAVICHNPDAKVAYLGLLSSADSYGSTLSSYLPSPVNLTLSKSRSTTYNSGSTDVTVSESNGGLGTSLLIYDFGKRENDLEQAELGLISAGLGYESALQNFIASALQGYYSLLIAQNAVEIAKESRDFAKESLEAALIRYDTGVAPLADKLQAEVSYAQAELSVEQSQNSLQQTQVALASQMGFPANTPIKVAELDDTQLMNDPFGKEAQALIALAKQKRLDLKSSRIGLKSAELAYEQFLQDQIATGSITLSANSSDIDLANNRTNYNHTISLGITIPIFSSWRDTYSKRIQRRNLKSQRESLKRTELNIEEAVINASNSYRTAKTSWEISWDQLAVATQLRDVALGRYEQGIGSILDVLSAQNQFSSALQSHLQTRLSLLTARISLIQAVGVLDLETMQPDAILRPKTSTTLPTQTPDNTTP